MASKFRPKDGQYYYQPHGVMWGIWQCRQYSDGICMDDFIKDCVSKEEAAEEVKSLNGWFQ